MDEEMGKKSWILDFRFWKSDLRFLFRIPKSAFPNQ